MDLTGDYSVQEINLVQKQCCLLFFKYAELVYVFVCVCKRKRSRKRSERHLELGKKSVGNRTLETWKWKGKRGRDGTSSCLGNGEFTVIAR